MDRDNKPLINDPDDGKEKAWVAVEVRSKGDVWKDQAFTQTTSSSTNSRGSEAKSAPMPTTLECSSGNQMGYDLAMGSPPIQDLHLLHQFHGESPRQFQQGYVSPNPSHRSSPMAASFNGTDSTAQYNENLTVPAYQGGFGTLRPGFASGRSDLTFSVTANYYGDSAPRSRSHRAQTTTKKSQVRQSKRMPSWMRYIILKLVGVKTGDNETVWFGTLFYVLTLGLALLYVSTHTLFLSYNAMSSKTTLTTIEASLQILNCFFGTSLGIYANRMCVKLFGNQKLIDSIRLHTKTVLKIRASTWAMLLMLVFIAADFYERYFEILKAPRTQPTPVPTSPSITTAAYLTSTSTSQGYITSCENVGLPKVVCILNVYVRFAFSTVAGLWNLLVLIVILSICRTHTVGIRRFIKELEADGRVIENHYRTQVMDVNVDMFSVMMNGVDELAPESDDEYDSSWQQNVPKQNTNNANSEIPIIRREIHEAAGAHSISESGPSYIQGRTDQQNLPRASIDTIGSDESRHGRILSVNDILLRYWSINSRLAFTGLVVQRWVTCWIIFVVFWVAQMIVYWIKNDTRIQEIFLVAIPSILLPLVCSALCEVNLEGDRVIRRLCPTSERLDLCLFITRNPLRLRIYGQSIRFGNMSNGLMGLATALFTGIAITKFTQNAH